MTERVNSDIIINEIDKSKCVPNFDEGPHVIIGPSPSENINPPIYIGPTISKPKWYQFWRWYLIPRYKRECKEAKEKFIETFGYPG